jgi:hypothetical protein
VRRVLPPVAFDEASREGAGEDIPLCDLVHASRRRAGRFGPHVAFVVVSRRNARRGTSPRNTPQLAKTETQTGATAVGPFRCLPIHPSSAHFWSRGSET